MDYKLPPPSDEQLQCIKYLAAGANVKVDSVAGSGKTTTILTICKHFANLKILVLTYNARLKLDCRGKLDTLKITNAECHSYHAFCCRYYQPKTFTDQDIINLLEANLEPIRQQRWDLMIMDEQQDQTPVLYRLACKIIGDLCAPDVQIMVLGDKNQTLYFYNKADPLFIELAHEIFPTERSWKTVNLSATYRVPREIAVFVNTRMLHYDRLMPVRDGGKVHYLMDDFNEPKTLNGVVDKFLEAKYKPEDIFILAYSVRSKRVSQLSNYMSLKHGKWIHVPTTDEQALTDTVMANKIVFGSMHQTKGLERKVVIIIGFDNSYFEYYNREVDRTKCPNPLYVACTRAQEHLVLLHDTKFQPLPFLKVDGLGIPNIQPHKLAPRKPYSMPVVDLLRGHDCEFLHNIEKKYLIVHDIANPGDEKLVHMRNEIKMTDNNTVYHEAVSHLYGTATTLASEVSLTAKCDSINWLAGRLTNSKMDGIIFDCIAKWFPVQNMKPTDFLQAANFISSYKGNGFKHQLRQIKGYKWVEGDKFKVLADRITAKTFREGAPASIFEEFVHYTHPKFPLVMLAGFIDIVQHNRIWEIKCVQHLTVEHRLQLAIYMAIKLAMTGIKPKQSILYNAVDGHTQLVEVADPAGFLSAMLANKTRQQSQGLTVDEFWDAIQYEEPEKINTPAPEMDGY